MRIWDLHPGYLNRQALLAEHRDLHAIHALLSADSQSFANHPEVKRWRGALSALALRHALVREEMLLRGYSHRSSLPCTPSGAQWPMDPRATPWEQLTDIRQKYDASGEGRIPLPSSAQHIWRQHKYSVMARDVNSYKRLGPQVARHRPTEPFAPLAHELTTLLQSQPSAGGIRNALLHMWGYLSELEPLLRGRVPGMALRELALATQRGAREHRQPYLLEQTALSELLVWIPTPGERP